MHRALTLSVKGLGYTRTNPLVGCVIVHKDRIIGEGWHKKHGAAHAEAEAINSVARSDRNLLADSTLYVTLEPCCHFGKTPPCTDLILEHKIPRVVIANPDPFPQVSGKGVERLRKNGVKVETGLLAEEAAFANRRFLCNQQKKRPYIVLKWAETADGFMAGSSPEQKQISGSLAKLLLHRWRSEEDAFLIGKNTLLQDRPLLNNRYWTGKSPAKVVLGNAVKEYAELPFFEVQAKTYLIGQNYELNSLTGADLVLLNPRNLDEVLAFLLREGISSLVVEGGRQILDSFLTAGLWDEIRVLKSKAVFFGSGYARPDLPKGTQLSQDLKDDTLTVLYKDVI